MDIKRLFPLSGIAFVALVVVSIVGLGGNTPDTDASATELATFYDDNAIRQGLGSFLLAAAVPFVVFFGVWLATALVPREVAGIPTWGYVVIAGTILVAGGVLLAAFAHFALANGGDERISPTALEALNSLDGNTWMVFNPAFGVMMLGAAGLLLTAGIMRWPGWIALVIGVVAFIPFADFFALLAALLWIAVVGLLQARAPKANATAAPAPAP